MAGCVPVNFRMDVRMHVYSAREGLYQICEILNVLVCAICFVLFSAFNMIANGGNIKLMASFLSCYMV